MNEYDFLRKYSKDIEDTINIPNISKELKCYSEVSINRGGITPTEVAAVGAIVTAIAAVIQSAMTIKSYAKDRADRIEEAKDKDKEDKRIEEAKDKVAKRLENILEPYKEQLNSKDIRKLIELVLSKPNK
jgi:hypothetical protein